MNELNIDNGGLISDNPIFANNRLEPKRSKQDVKVHRYALDFFRNEFLMTLSWARLVLKTVREVYPQHGPRVSGPIGGIGFLSVFPLLMSPIRLRDFVLDFKSSYLCGDHQGMGLNLVNFVQTLEDGFEYGMVIANSLHDLWSHIDIAQFANSLFVPIALCSVSLDIVTQSIKSYKIYKLLQKVEKDFAGFVEEFHNYSAQEVGEEEGLKKVLAMKKMRERQLTRCGSDKVCEVVKAGNLDAAADVATYLKRKIALIGVTQLVNVISLVAILILATTAPYIPLALFTLCAFVKVGLYIYKTHYMSRDLPSLA